MFRLPKMTDYAVVILSTLEREARGATAQTALALAARTGLSLPTVAKILKKLAKAGMVTAQRGMRGGYRLQRPAAQITMADIAGAMDGPVAVTDCVEGAEGQCSMRANCLLHEQWTKINRAVYAALASVTLTDMAEAGEGSAVETPAPMPGQLAG